MKRVLFSLVLIFQLATLGQAQPRLAPQNLGAPKTTPKPKATPVPKATPTPKPKAATPKPFETGAAPVLKIMKAQVSSPLYVQDSAGVNTLTNVTLTATATPSKEGTPVDVVFNPGLGESGKAVIAAVTKLLTTVHGRWPAGSHIEITCTPAMAPDDAPAAALATALMLDSMFKGWEADTTCSIIGGLLPTGKIQGATSALMRLTTASRGNSSRILMPERNVTQAADCLVNEGVAGSGRIQMFAVKDFEDVLQMAAVKLDPGMAASIEIFNEAQKTISKAGDKAEDLIKDSDLKEEIRTVLEKWPNHMTARLLLGRAIGRYTHFSLSSSVEAIERISVTLQGGIQSSRPFDVSKLPVEKITDELERLKRANVRLDPKATKYIGAVIRYGESAQSWFTKPPRDANEVNVVTTALANAAGQARDARSELAAALAAELQL